MEQTPHSGKVLISEPFLQDPNFARTVILIAEHNDEGTIGYILNQKTEFTVELLIAELEGITAPVFQGGPVQLESFHYLHKYPEIDGAIEVKDGLFWSGDFDAVKSGLSNGSLDPVNFLFFIGYSGWATGQLEIELEEKAWIVSDLDPEKIFAKENNEGELWKEAMRALGGSFALLANSPINPQFN